MLKIINKIMRRTIYEINNFFRLKPVKRNFMGKQRNDSGLDSTSSYKSTGLKYS